MRISHALARLAHGEPTRRIRPEGGLPEGVHSTEGFARVLRRERDRADRNAQVLSLLTLEFAPENDPEDVRQVGAQLRARLRSTDELGWLDEKRMGVALPNTEPEGAWKLAEYIRLELVEFNPTPRYTVYSYPTFGRAEPGHDSGRPGSSGDDRGHAPRRNGAPLAPRNGTASGHVNGTSIHAEAQGGDRRGRPAAMRRSGFEAGGPALSLDALPETEFAPASLPLESLFLSPLPLWKRACDVALSALGLVVLSPLMATAAVAVAVSTPGPVIFRQKRAGLGGRSFDFLKFRTMHVDAEARLASLRDQNEVSGPVFKMTNDPRITPVGRILRKTSIDELPQLWNVLKGDMTLVGPRPPILDEVAEYTTWQRRRLDVTTGLTCLWQVNGRSNIPFESWTRLDIDYARRRSLSLDLQILMRTLPAVISMRGAK